MSTDFQFDPHSNFAGRAEAACIKYMAALGAPESMASPPNEWWKAWAHVIPNAGLITRVFIPVHGFKFKDFTGTMAFSGASTVFQDVRRQVKQAGAKANAMALAELDLAAFDRTPQSLNTAAAKLPQQGFATALNAAYTTLDWTGTNFFRLTAVKANCPGKPSMGKFLNAYENSALNIANITIAIKNIQSRKGFDGELLDLDPMVLKVPSSMKETARQLVEVMQLIPSTDGVSSGGGNTNPVFGRLRVESIPGLRDDLWIVAADVGDELMKPLIYVTGGTGSDYSPNDDTSNVGKGVPHMMTIPFLQDSDMYKTTLEMGVSVLVNEGYALKTPHALCGMYTGAAS